jgi:FtsP/CotA-like multicopper oxidase with cupredoxin domain
MDRRQRFALLGVAAVIAAVVAIVAIASGGSDDKSGTTASTTQAGRPGDTTQQTTTTTTSTTTTTTDTAPQAPQPVVEKIEIKGGQPVGGPKKISVKKGQQVEIDVTSDATGQAHLHGYDIEKKLEPGKTVKFAFKADIEGVFEFELHPSTELAKVTVKA